MCHHGDERALESWRDDLDEADEAELGDDHDPSFLNEESDVEMDLLEADDD